MIVTNIVVVNVVDRIAHRVATQIDRFLASVRCIPGREHEGQDMCWIKDPAFLANRPFQHAVLAYTR